MNNKILNLLKISFVTLTKQKIIVSILLIVQVVCCIALMYSYALGLFFINMTRNSNMFDFHYEEGISMGEIRTKMQNLDKESVYTDAYFYITEDKSVVAAKNNYFNNIVKGTIIDNSNEENQILIPSSEDENDDAVQINEMIEFWDKQYKVVGISAFEPIEVNWNSVDNDTKVFAVQIENNEIRNTIAEKKFNKSLEAIFDKKLVEKPAGTLNEIANGAIIFVLIVVLVGMCAISFAIGIKSIQDKRKNSFHVIKLIGMSKLKAYLWMVFEILCLNIVIWIISSLAYLGLDAFIFSKMLGSLLVFPQLIFFEYVKLGLIYILFVGILASLISTKELLSNNE